MVNKVISSHEQEDAAVDLARVAARATYEDLPPSVVEVVKVAILDTIACALGGSATETIEELVW
jgi:2-methylcitrate dehydratase PrpD